MSKRCDYYYDKNEKKTRCKDADGKMFFRVISGLKDLKRNSRAERSVIFDFDFVHRFPNDTALVIFNQSENSILYYEKWKIYYTEPVNLVNNGNGKIDIYIPYKMFSSIGCYSWLDFDGGNVTWDSIKDSFILNPVPDFIDYQISFFKDAIAEARSRS